MAATRISPAGARSGFRERSIGYRADEQEIDHVVEREPQSVRDLPRAARHQSIALPAIGSGNPPPADVLIVGGGAVGGFVARELVKAGLNVVILEAGPERTGREHAMDELLATAFRNRGGDAKFNDEVPTWRTRPGETTRRAVMSQGLETALGGNSVAWGAVAMRFYEDDFRIRSTTVARYGEAAIPLDSTLADWPLVLFRSRPLL